jgi:hypothetical protein
MPYTNINIFPEKRGSKFFKKTFGAAEFYKKMGQKKSQ